jgi:hypothetical protein
MKTGAQTLHLSCRRCIIGRVWVQSESSPSSCSFYAKLGFVPYAWFVAPGHHVSHMDPDAGQNHWRWAQTLPATTRCPMAHAKTQPCCPALCPHGYPVIPAFSNARCVLDALRMPSRAASAQCGVAGDRLHDAQQVSVVCCISYVLCVSCPSKREIPLTRLP